MKKAKKVRVARKTLTEKLAAAEQRGYENGVALGKIEASKWYVPNWQHQKNITDVVRMIESWGNMSDDGVIMIAGTDLKHHCNAAVPLRLLRVIGDELKRLGYKP